MATVVQVDALGNFLPAEDSHFRTAAAALEGAVNHRDFAGRVLATSFREAIFIDALRNRSTKTPAEILAIIQGGVERGTTGDGAIRIAINKDRTIDEPVVGITTLGKLPFRTGSWFVEGCTRRGDGVSVARHMIHEWLHVAGFKHKRNNGYRRDVNYLVGDIIRSILRSSDKAGEIAEDPEMAALLDRSLEIVHDED